MGFLEIQSWALKLRKYITVPSYHHWLLWTGVVWLFSAEE